MVSRHYLVLFLCLTSGLWLKANAQDGNAEEEPDDEEEQCCKSCPDGWTPHEEKCYRFHFEKKSWGEAERTCTHMGGNLASLPNNGVHAFLRDGIKRVTGAFTSTWVGGYDAVQEGLWMWSDGARFEFKGWSGPEPNNHGGKEHCMEINFNGRDYINDADCEKAKSFVCAKNMEETSQ